MDADLVWALSMGIAFVSWGAMTLAGWRYWVRTKASQPVDQVTPAFQDAIRDEVDRALADRDGELAELHERLDFAERVLSQLGPGGAVGDREQPSERPVVS